MLTIRMGARRALYTVGKEVVGSAWLLASMVVDLDWLRSIPAPLCAPTLSLCSSCSLGHQVSVSPMCPTARWLS